MIDTSKIGTELTPVTFTVERGKIQEVARALRDDNPVYFGERPPAPLTFTRTFAVWAESVFQAYLDIGVDVTRIVHGGQDFEFCEPIFAGDVLTMTGTLKDIHTKQGKRGGVLEFIVWEWIYTNQHGRVVVRSVNTTIHTSKAAVDDNQGPPT